MEKKVLEIMKILFELETVDDTCSQATCEKWDSMMHLNLIVELEAEFGVSFEPEEIGEMQSYKKIIEIMKSKLA